MSDKEYFNELIEWIKDEKPSKEKLAKYKNKLCKKYKRRLIPTDIEVYMHASSDDAKRIRKYVETKPTRTGSGVAIVATMMAPFKCPHGKCVFCPGGPGSEFGDVPQSYTGNEPSTMRAIRNDYDSYRIVFNRLEQYVVIGQNPDKVDQIIMGGTFCSVPKDYQKDFIYYSFKAYNDFSRLFYDKDGLNLDKFKEFFELPGSVLDDSRTEKIKKKILAEKVKDVKTLEEEHKINETAAIRCIGLTIETRPDEGTEDKSFELLNYGVTRVELGIQSVYDEVLKISGRGHTFADSIKSIAELRDFGFKLNLHIMPGLPGKDKHRISRERDIENFRQFFENEGIKPDMMKIYPCMVMPGTVLFDWYKKGLFIPLSTREAAEIIVEGFKFIPEYCRVMRVQRDIPTYVTSSGVDKTNLRQYVDEIAKKEKVIFRDIRAREIRQQSVKGTPEIIVREYRANDGKEFFISSEADDKLLGFVRLRIPPRKLHKVIGDNGALIRELHVYGSAVEIGDDKAEKVQHKGIGKKLMAAAEKIAIEEGREKIVIISGVGVREYYRKLGYEKEGPYMVKKV
ncbi:tRNA uridine(34) 5-carboxymethylaminomethyl modification radical SAM/GNAT enzyme Elp3 [Candidatus Woesearchaeota archaeon]|nr:tRNA uridine(34) 5-carboxymethylaminomethyl modification radical SAM/GNAT enzyme Elp3 [Candidatus Woesearchaeota archaeon]